MHIGVEDQNCDKEAHSMKSKKRSGVLTKECLTREVKNGHEGPKAQKRRKKKEKGKKRRGTRLRPRAGSPSSKK